MKIKMNSLDYDVPEGTSLTTFIESLDLDQQGMAVAVDFLVIPKERWDETILPENADLIVVQAISGG